MELLKIVYITQLVNDQTKALAFYTSVLGFEKRIDNPTPGGEPRFLTLALQGQDFQLVHWTGTPGQAHLAIGKGVSEMRIDDGRVQHVFIHEMGHALGGLPRR